MPNAVDNFSYIGLWFPITDPVNPNYWLSVALIMGCDKQKKEIKEIKKSIYAKTDYFDFILFYFAPKESNWHDCKSYSNLTSTWSSLLQST